MNNDMLAEYSYLWDGSDPGWVLLKDPAGGDSVFHKTHSIALLIESDETHKAVCRRMQEGGCEILEEMPPGNPEVTASPA